MEPRSDGTGARAGGSGDSAVTAETWEGPVEAAIQRWQDVPGGLMPLLHDVQDALGWIPPDAHARIAEGMNLSQADVYGVVTFYHDFRSAPPGRHVLKVCRAEACQAMGSEELAAQLKARAGAGFGETTPDGAVTVEAVYCLGNCACAPSVQIDGKLVGRVTVERLGQIVKSAKASPSPRAGAAQ